MELKDLVGRHMFSGIEEGQIGQDCNTIKFTLDSIHYMAVEDPNDGYRSYLSDVVITDEAPKYVFPPVPVVCTTDNIIDNDILEFYDIITHSLVLRIGTENLDDYYPTCIIDYYPENLNINR